MSLKKKWCNNIVACFTNQSEKLTWPWTTNYRLSGNSSLPHVLQVQRFQDAYQLYSFSGFFWRDLMMTGAEEEAWNFLAVCVPIVVFFAPFGSFLASHFHRQVLAALIYILDSIALVRSPKSVLKNSLLKTSLFPDHCFCRDSNDYKSRDFMWFITFGRFHLFPLYLKTGRKIA